MCALCILFYMSACICFYLVFWFVPFGLIADGVALEDFGHSRQKSIANLSVCYDEQRMLVIGKNKLPVQVNR